MKAKLFGKQIEREEKPAQEIKQEGYEFHNLPNTVRPNVLDGLSDLERYIVTGIANCKLIAKDGQVYPHSTGRQHFNYIAYRAMALADDTREAIAEWTEKLSRVYGWNKYSQENPTLDFEDFTQMVRKSKSGDLSSEFTSELWKNRHWRRRNDWDQSTGIEGFCQGLINKEKLVRRKLSTTYRVSPEKSEITDKKDAKQLSISPYFIIPGSQLTLEVNPRQIGSLLAEIVEELHQINHYALSEIWQSNGISDDLNGNKVAMTLYESIEKNYGVDLSEKKTQKAKGLTSDLKLKTRDITEGEDSIFGKNWYYGLVSSSLPFLDKYDPEGAAELRKILEELK
jgi:hypothetical protein